MYKLTLNSIIIEHFSWGKQSYYVVKVGFELMVLLIQLPNSELTGMSPHVWPNIIIFASNSL